MASNKVMICPICGGKAIVNGALHDWKTICLDCEKEVIPLVTPQQEVESEYFGATKT